MAMLLTIVLLIALNHFAKSQPPTFNPYQFELDGFELTRGYFSSLDNKQSCQDILQSQDCIYSNLINPPNILFLHSSPLSTTFTSSFKLNAEEAIVIAGFAPPISKKFTITPYASFINGVESFSSISNNSLSLTSTFFVAVISGDLYTFELIRQWVRTANTSLTTAIYNNPDRYLYHIPIVQANDELNVNGNTEYSVIIRHETINSLQQDLHDIFSQSPSLLAWKVSTVNVYDKSQSEIVTKLHQIRQFGHNEWSLSLKKISTKKCKRHKSQIINIDQNEFTVANYNSCECLINGIKCSFDEPNSVIFKSSQFTLSSDIKITISGINHIKTGNGIFSTINIIDSEDRSIISKITLNEIMDEHDERYIVVFSDNCNKCNPKYQCQEILDINKIYGKTVQIVEITTNDIGIDYLDLQPPKAVICINKKSKPKKKKKTRRRKPSRYSKSKSSTAQKPNILMFLLDDLG